MRCYLISLILFPFLQRGHINCISQLLLCKKPGTEYPWHRTTSIYLACACAGWMTPAEFVYIPAGWPGSASYRCWAASVFDAVLLIHICSHVSLFPLGTTELVRSWSSHGEDGGETCKASEDWCPNWHIIEPASFCQPKQVTRPGPKAMPFLQWEEWESHLAKGSDKGRGTVLSW